MLLLFTRRTTKREDFDWTGIAWSFFVASNGNSVSQQRLSATNPYNVSLLLTSIETQLMRFIRIACLLPVKALRCYQYNPLLNQRLVMGKWILHHQGSRSVQLRVVSVHHRENLRFWTDCRSKATTVIIACLKTYNYEDYKPLLFVSSLSCNYHSNKLNIHDIFL